MPERGWPATVASGSVRLRPIRRRDRGRWTALREANRAWLAPWEATGPAEEAGPASYADYVRRLRREAARGVALPWLIEWEGRLAGQLLITGIALGSARSGSAGYWVAREAAGRGVAPTALALAFDHAVGAAGLHRIEVAIRPDNRASLRVVAKLGFRDEGMRARYLHVGGRWADHRIFALTAEDVPEGLVARWRGSGGSCDSGVY